MQMAEERTQASLNWRRQMGPPQHSKFRVPPATDSVNVQTYRNVVKLK